MIERGDFAGFEPSVEPLAHDSAWGGRDPLAGLAFVVVTATGSDPAVDGVLKLEALRRDALGFGFERFECVCRPFAQTMEGDGGAGARLARAAARFGLDADELALAPSAKDAWLELEQFLGDVTVVSPDYDVFAAWWSHQRGPRSVRPKHVGLDRVAELLLALRPSASSQVSEIRSCRELAEELSRVVGRFLGLDRGSLRLALATLLASRAALAQVDGELAEALRVVLHLVDRPSTWIEAAGEAALAFPDGTARSAAAGVELASAATVVRDSIDDLRPRAALLADLADLDETVPVHREEAAPLGDRDLELVDAVFREHLPALAAARGGSISYRPGQHQVAREVARTLGQHELLLVHAPTGTGKTLAYLVPALIWSARANRRIAISTYTRTLQEQAMTREVPRAAAALERAGFDRRPRVTSLKGRSNYLCWRALKAHVPAQDDDAAAWLAWSALAIFALVEPEGDLDRFAPRLALGGANREHLEREFEPLLAAVRAQVGCCHDRGDRRTCAAEIARARAEHAHVVITNHAFALARQDFFKNVIFDECEHLHEQAHGAWSHTIALSEMRETCTRLGAREATGSRAPLKRLEALAFDRPTTLAALEECFAAQELALGALDGLTNAIAGFKRWRERAAGGRTDRERFSLLREWLESDASAPLVEAHAALLASFARLDENLAALIASLASLPAKGLARLRRSLERSRVAVVEIVEALEAWLPRKDGKPALVRETFYDLEEDPRRGDVLAARVLLPNEFLGRYYYPQLWSGVLISATTWLRGGFECAEGYLGLDRAREPLEFEDREPSIVRTARAEDPFDYERVQVFVPRDAPEYTTERERFHEYVRRFVAHLAERTRGRMLVLFTNADELRRCALGLESFFAARRIPFWWQNMRGTSKEELGELFRAHADSVLFGVDTFWYGADFAGDTLEYLVIVKLPWGVPDRYHHAQCAALGSSEQRRRIYLPRALAKFRQGFGRLMRRESDKGSVFVLDTRILHGANRLFLAELPLSGGLEGMEDHAWRSNGAPLCVADTDTCVRRALEHGGRLDDVARRGLDTPFAHPAAPEEVTEASSVREPDVVLDPPPKPTRKRRSRSERPNLDVSPDDLPF
ncbi:MAG: hypothetical protein K8S98_07920 [Planctomycetes bacterium]|nr:hypothetical protein [Planctomycetota bacterium]